MKMNPKSALASGLLTLALLGGCPSPSHQQLREPPAQPTPSVQKTAAAPLSVAAPATQAPQRPATDGRLIDSGLIIEAFSEKLGAKDLKQVPSEVIDTGFFRYVPYYSYEASQFELNIYGDPRHPAGVEIGVYAGKQSTKEEIRGLMARLLQQAADRELIHGLELTQDKIERAGLTFEVTPPTADDAFGAWWISIYDASAIEKARASDAELKTIAVAAPKDERAAPEKKKPAKKKAGKKTERVYIEDYTKKDGAYVNPDL